MLLAPYPVELSWLQPPQLRKTQHRPSESGKQTPGPGCFHFQLLIRGISRDSPAHFSLRRSGAQEVGDIWLCLFENEGDQDKRPMERFMEPNLIGCRSRHFLHQKRLRVFLLTPIREFQENLVALEVSVKIAGTYG